MDNAAAFVVVVASMLFQTNDGFLLSLTHTHTQMNFLDTCYGCGHVVVAASLLVECCEVSVKLLLDAAIATDDSNPWKQHKGCHQQSWSHFWIATRTFREQHG